MIKLNPNDMQCNIIAVSGKARHGKDTLADYIIKAFNLAMEDYRFGNDEEYTAPTLMYGAKIAFADPIKKAAKIIFPQLSDEDLWGPSERRNKVISEYVNPDTQEPLTVRNVLTQLGAWGRSTNPDCWANSTIGSAKKILMNYGLVVISDLRFINELRIVRENGGKIVRIVRPSVTYKVDDVSEKDLDGYEDFDMTALNNDGLSQLENIAQEAVYNLIFNMDNPYNKYSRRSGDKIKG
ncbi:MAG TPA: hypothetical protein VMX17_11915 [Candidatus Glassbacteria bacterium]|nr:hypothetical protein [Candidatus Glassbacteria bacterium]